MQVKRNCVSVRTELNLVKLFSLKFKILLAKEFCNDDVEVETVVSKLDDVLLPQITTSCLVIAGWESQQQRG